MLNKQRQLHIVKSNEGFSLIETIVSLLILTIIIVSLLNMFVFNAKTNKRAEEQQAATLVGTNIIEEIKQLGVEKWAAKRGWDLSAESMAFEKSKGPFYFDVEVTCEPAKHTSSGGILWNKYQMADISKLNRDTTAIVDPFERFAGSTGTAIDTYDDMAVTAFLNEHKEAIYEERMKYLDKNPDADIPPDPVAYTPAELRGKIARETIVTIKDDSESGEKGRSVSVIIKYNLLCDEQYHYGKNLDELVYDEPVPEETHEEISEGFYADVKFSSLEDIYLFHTPLSGGANTWRDDEIIVNDMSKGSGQIGNLFIAPQIHDVSMSIPCGVEIKPSTNWNVYYLSDDSKFESKNQYLINGKGRVPAYRMGDVAIITKENQLTEKQPAETRLYQITVKVIRQGTTKELITIDMEGR